MRIRSIKPEFYQSEDVAALSWEARLIFIGLWSYVDDNGVGRDVERLIVADLFPLDEDPRETLARVSRGLQELSGQSLITRYTVENRPYLWITGWARHQRIDKPNKARYPLPTREDAEIRESVARPSRECRESPVPGTGEQGNRGTGEQGIPPTAARREPPPDDDPEPEPIEGELVEPDNAQTLVGEWLDNTNPRPPRQVVGQVSRQIKALLDEGQSYTDVRNGLALWARKRLHPSTLPSVVHEAQQPRPARMTKGDHQRAILAQFMERETA
ncbi:hypothetical protein ACQCX2_07730 [Propionibacteriaceae bacterium Y1700]|uniref:hypothetical protein n=1 Tax=Microlunatus sp. Y1700 TaxID=3418487 RepID=UPI003DA77869